ncbi:Thrombospondin type 1 domain [Halocaridina rubra]|uniref:Thrombospondin type 1 domain n=1 Tax=Halocaridina rubra TaxID=373956 RepID=A0AAN9AAR7_HALRR
MSKSASEEEEEEQPEETQEEVEEPGLTLERLAAMYNMAKELQQLLQEHDDNMVRSVTCNIIDDAMTPYKTIFAQKKKQRQQLPITMFFSRKKQPSEFIQYVQNKFSPQCSATCGGGIKTRTVRCQQVLARGEKDDRPSRDCLQRRPRTLRKCNQRPCQGDFFGHEKSIIRAQTNQDYVQSKFMKKLTLKIGGRATVFRGVRVKVKCPVRRFDRSKITWWHDGQQIARSGPIKTTRKGVLKIRRVQYPDSGVYVCRADKSEGNLTLLVIPLPSSYGSSETLENRPTGSSANEVSLHTNEDTNGFNQGWKPSISEDGARRGGYRRQGGRIGGRRRNKLEGFQLKETTLRPIQPFPSSPNSDTLGEGPFKASSKNMHTVEMTSGESSNVFDPNLWQTNVEKQKANEEEYIYGTITHHMKPDDHNENVHSRWNVDRDPVIYGSNNHIPEEKTTEEAEHVYGKVTHHSDGSRITSEENPVYGTVYHRLPGSVDGQYLPGRTIWPNLPTSTEDHTAGRKTSYNGENGNAIDSDLKELGNKLSLATEEVINEDEINWLHSMQIYTDKLNGILRWGMPHLTEQEKADQIVFSYNTDEIDIVPLCETH